MYNIRVCVCVFILAIITVCGEIIPIRRHKHVLFQYNSILNVTSSSWISCAELCSRMKVCKSIHYISRNRTCHILDDMQGTCPLTDSIGDTFLNRTEIPNNIAGNCDNNNCEINELCIEQTKGYDCIRLEKPKPKEYIDLKMLSCDFEDGNICAWIQTPCSANGDNFEWVSGKGRTESQWTGPTADHTIGTIVGTYMYIDASYAPNYNFAELATPLLPGNLTCCLTLWYHMYGTSINKLVVGIKFQADSHIFRPLATIAGHQDSSWHQLRVSLDSASDFYVGIRAYKGDDYLGDICIDDIVLSYGLC